MIPNEQNWEVRLAPEQWTTEKLAAGLGWPEGPAVLDDGRVVFVETFQGRLSIWDRNHGVQQHADIGGGPNAAAVGADGNIYITQNGGIVGPWRSPRPQPPSIQRISAAGHVDTVVTTTASRALSAPNDLAFGPDGCLYFTDPGGGYSPGSQPDPGYICVLRPDGSCEVLQETGRAYPNGIVVEPDGSIVWVESYTRAVRRHRTNSGVEDVCVLPEAGAPDGLAISSEGELYITATKAKGIDIIGNEGTYKGFIPVDGIPTNCAFDGDVLYVTDGGGLGLSGRVELTGQLWAIKIAGARGMPLHRGQIG